MRNPGGYHAGGTGDEDRGAREGARGDRTRHARGRGPHARPVPRARRAPRGGRVDGSPAGRLGPLHERGRGVPEGGRSKVNTPPVVSPEEWKTAREELLVKEKEHTRARDALAAQRRRMPWLAVDKEYAFDGPDGEAGLVDLFAGRRQLIVYRAFFEEGVRGWPDHACIGCSMVAD